MTPFEQESLQRSLYDNCDSSSQCAAAHFIILQLDNSENIIPPWSSLIHIGLGSIRIPEYLLFDIRCVQIYIYIYLYHIHNNRVSFENTSFTRIFQTIMQWFLGRFPGAVAGVANAVSRRQLLAATSDSSDECWWSAWLRPSLWGCEIHHPTLWGSWDVQMERSDASSTFNRSLIQSKHFPGVCLKIWGTKIQQGFGGDAQFRWLVFGAPLFLRHPTC